MKEAYILSQGSQLGGNTHHFHLSSIVDNNLAKHLPLYSKGGWTCSPGQKTTHTTTDYYSGSRRKYILADSQLSPPPGREHEHRQKTNNEVSLSSEDGAKRVSKDMSALLAFFELFNVSKRDYDCLGAGNKDSWLISLSNLEWVLAPCSALDLLPDFMSTKSLQSRLTLV